MKAFPSAVRVQELMEMKADERYQSRYNPEQHLMDNVKRPGSIIVDNVSFSYSGGSEYDLENISLLIPGGSSLGIIGGTGSGKTTLVKLLSHTYDATKGEIEIDGQNVKRIEDSKLSEYFGVVPQHASLFHGTIRSNLSMTENNASDDEIKSALNIAQALDFVEAKEGGLDAEVTGRGSNFSGGQRQRLTIARALIGKPKILILDDSSSALDLATESKLRAALRRLMWKPTIIIISQRASAVRDTDQILVLDDGKCVGLGTHEELLETCETYQEIYYCQFPREEAKA